MKLCESQCTPQPDTSDWKTVQTCKRSSIHLDWFQNGRIWFKTDLDGCKIRLNHFRLDQSIKLLLQIPPDKKLGCSPPASQDALWLPSYPTPPTHTPLPVRWASLCPGLSSPAEPSGLSQIWGSKAALGPTPVRVCTAGGNPWGGVEGFSP